MGNQLQVVETPRELDRGRARLLLVDDNVDDLLYYTSILQHLAYDVRPCASFTEAANFFARDDFDLYRSAMGLQPGTPIPMEFVRQLQVYFDVDFEMVFWRLLSLGWIDPAQIATLLEANADSLPQLQEPVRDSSPGGRLVPERFIHLVASAFGRGRIEIEEAAEFLGTDLDEAQYILDQFHYEDSEAGAAAPGAKRPHARTSPRESKSAARPYRKPHPN